MKIRIAVLSRKKHVFIKSQKGSVLETVVFEGNVNKLTPVVNEVAKNINAIKLCTRDGGMHIDPTAKELKDNLRSYIESCLPRLETGFETIIYDNEGLDLRIEYISGEQVSLINPINPAVMERKLSVLGRRYERRTNKESHANY